MTEDEADARLAEIVDWARFREEVYLTVCDGCRQYVQRRKGSTGEPIYQILLWTDTPSRLTGLDLLTCAARVQIGAFRVERVKDELQRVPLGPTGHGGWDFARFHVIVNQSLSPLTSPEWRAPDRLDLIQSRVGIEMLAAKRQLERDCVLLSLPRRGEFFFDVEWLLD